MDELIKALKTLLANNITMYLKASGFHWNVEGDDFTQFHNFFGAVYEDVYGVIDPLAENLRKLRAMAPFAVSTIDTLRTIEDKPTSSDALEMVVALTDANDIMIENIAAAFKAATAVGEQGIANFLADRDGMHKKWRWQMDSMLKRHI